MIKMKLKLQLAKMLQQFSETKVKNSEGNEVIFVSDMTIGVGSEVFISNEAGEMIIPSNGDYIGEDETVYTVLDGVVTAVTPKVQEEEIEEEIEVKAEALTIDEIVNAISPIIEQAITKVKEDILAEVDAKLSKISFSKPADLEIKDGETKPKNKNRAAEILASK